jgi:trimeric autotransporter adhesin
MDFITGAGAASGQSRRLGTGRIRSVWTACSVVFLTAISFAQTNLGSVPATAGSWHPAPALMTRPAPPGLSASTQGQIAAEIGRVDPVYHAAAQPAGVAMTNPEHGMDAAFTSKSVTFRRGTHEWITSLRRYGYGSRLMDAAAVEPSARANRVEYRRGLLTEWYLNGPLGLEQGFTLERAPGEANGEPLTLTFAMAGNLTPTVNAGGRGLTMLKDDSPALRYSGLTAVDARGRELDTWLDIADGQLHLQVDDRDAAYPLTIDPFVLGAKLTTAYTCSAGICDEGSAYDGFGRSLAMSADGTTLVVGVPGKILNGVRTGAAYVFVKPADAAGGWESAPIYYKTRLYALDGATAGVFLGSSVAISADGSTIVAGAINTSPSAGAAYVFRRGGPTWEALSQTQAGKLRASSPVFDSSAFGTSVAISGDGGTVVVGSPYESQFSTTVYGRAYYFRRPAIGWGNMTESGTIGVGVPGVQMRGWSVAISSDASTIVVGAIKTDTHTGSASIALRQQVPGFPDSYVDGGHLQASDRLPYDIFGYAVSIDADGSTIVVGAPTTSWGPDISYREGAAYVFERPASGWGRSYDFFPEAGKLLASDRRAGDSFGIAVGVSGDGGTVAVGASHMPLSSGPFNGNGAVYVFAEPEAGWSMATEDTKVNSPDAQSPSFGHSVALNSNGTVVIAGAPYATIANRTFQGAAFVTTGSALSPMASVSPESLTFGPQGVGTTSAAQTVTVTNTGGAPLQMSAVAVSGPFTATQNCLSASPIAPGASCVESIAFAPTTGGAASGTLTFTDNSGGTAGTIQNVPLTGVGVKAGSVTTIASISPSPALVGQPVTIAYSVAAAAGVALTPSGTVTIQASTGESCTGNAPSGACAITFSTAADRTVTASYSGDDSFDGSTSSNSQLRIGNFTLAVSPSSQTVSGRRATYRITVAGINGFTGVVSLACSGAAAGSTCAVLPASVSASASGAAARATLTLPAGTAAGTYTVTFTGSIGSATRSVTATLIVR